MTRIMMVLAHGPGLPDGDLLDRMTLMASLTAQGYLDGAQSDGEQPEGTAVRERPGKPDKHSKLVSEEGSWVLRGLEGDDDPLWAIDARILRPGEPVVLRRPDGEELIYRIVASEQA